MLPRTWVTGLWDKPTISISHLRRSNPLRATQSLVIADIWDPLSNSTRTEWQIPRSSKIQTTTVTNNTVRPDADIPENVVLLPPTSPLSIGTTTWSVIAVDFDSDWKCNKVWWRYWHLLHRYLDLHVSTMWAELKHNKQNVFVWTYSRRWCTEYFLNSGQWYKKCTPRL